MSESIPLSKGERTRRAIVDAAHLLFVEQGYAATSMRQIAERSGLALGGIYNHFPNKEAIFSEVMVVKHPFHEVLPLLQAAAGDTVEQFVRNAAKNMVKELGRRPDFIKLMFVELVEFEGKDLPKMFGVVFPQVLPLVERFRKQKGEIRDIDPFVLFRAFLGLFFSYYMTEFMLHDLPITRLQKNPLDSFVDIFLYGVLAPKDKK
jgi:AcrR family transcriptional regulator